MKKLLAVVMLFVPALAVAHKLDQQLERLTAQAFAQSVVQVQVKLVKPVHISDMMLRPVRGKDVVIRTDYKQNRCTGRLSVQRTHVIVPLSCVEDNNYKAEQIYLVFTDGRRIEKSGKSVKIQKNTARILL